MVIPIKSARVEHEEMQYAAAARVAMPWYHVSPHDLPDGTELVPGGHGRSMFNDMYKAHPNNQGRSQYVWVTDTPEHAHDWSSVIAEDTGTRPNHMYEVEPHAEPEVYDHEYPDDEWTTPGATIKRKLDWKF